MKNNLLMDFSIDKENSTVKVKREFAAPISNVWAAWTERELLDQWWAPKPWKARTKLMDFKVGGQRLYAMVGPAGEEHWALADYKSITPTTNFKFLDAFCDNEGNINKDFPRSDWNVDFAESGDLTIVNIKIKHETLSDLEKIIEMGFKEGFASALGNLEQYLEVQFKLRNENKTNNMSRTSTYLNFPGNTEEAFNFYKSVFGTEFNGNGIQRFGDIPVDATHPPIDEKVKKMVLHVELPILGGHILMATDSPKEMGMSVTQGNNMHICLEPSTKEETKKLFDALSQGGNIIMPLADMFFGAYFGTFTDRFGINWMLNCIEKK